MAMALKSENDILTSELRQRPRRGFAGSWLIMQNPPLAISLKTRGK